MAGEHRPSEMMKYTLCVYIYFFLTSTYLSDLSEVTAHELSLAVEMMRFLSWVVTHRPTLLGSSQWDFLLCSMLAWLEVSRPIRSCVALTVKEIVSEHLTRLLFPCDLRLRVRT